MYNKDRGFERFRSLYAQRPTQSSALRRTFVFNAEVAENACMSYIASCNQNKLAHEGIIEHIPGFSAQSMNTSPSTYPTGLHYIYREIGH